MCSGEIEATYPSHRRNQLDWLGCKLLEAFLSACQVADHLQSSGKRRLGKILVFPALSKF